MFNGKYTTKKTAMKYGLDSRIDDFVASMADFENTVKIGADYVEIFDAETGESMDVAHYVLITGKDGQKYGNLLTTEMESILTVGEDENDWISTILTEVNIDGLPLCVR
jgi:hypothetical protein